MKRLFNLDLHISVIEDIKDICKRLYGDQVEITNWSISGHNWVFGKETPNVEFINQYTWKHINQDMIDSFQLCYGEELSRYDGFVVTHTPVFAMLYETFQKPILIVNTCRYDQPFCWTKDGAMKQAFHECLHRLNAKGLLTIVSNNVADQTYLKERTGLASIHIPSLCLYTHATYKPTKKQFIFTGKHSFPPFYLLQEKPANHTWEELYSYRGIVHAPYEMSTMSFFEQYWAGVPLFVPSKEFYFKCIVENKMEFIPIYEKWKEELHEEEVRAWLDKADFYIFPFVHTFDSYEHLLYLLETFEDTDYEARMKWLHAAKEAILVQWKAQLDTFLGLE